MKTIINLKIDEYCLKPEIGVVPSFEENEAVIDLYISSDIKFEEILSKEKFSKLLIEALYFMNGYNDDDGIFEYSIEIINYLLKMKEEIFSTIGEIYLEPTLETVEYVKNNPIIKTYPLVLNEKFSINNDDLASIDEYFMTLENLKLYIDGNQKKVSIIDYKNTVNAIDEIVTKIKKYHLSPLEQVMYAYDLTRDRVYIKESENEDYSVSRDLSAVLSGNKIVCVGFANILDKILKNLNIKSDMVTLANRGKNVGHVRNIIYIKDDKYNIEAMYYLDPTWDSKKTEMDRNYLNSYNYFCRTKEEMDIISMIHGQDYVNRRFDAFSEDTVWKFGEIVKNEGVKALPKNIISAINQISIFIDEKKLINPLALSDNPAIPRFFRESFKFEEVFERLCDYKRIMFDNTLTSEKLLELLMNVRKIEFYDNPEKYPYDMRAIGNVVVNRQEAMFRNRTLKQFLSSILEDISLDRKMSFEKFRKIAEKKEYEKQIEQVKLAKVLSRVYVKKR